MTKQPESSPWVYAAFGQICIGLPIGVVISVLAVNERGWLLEKVLRNNVLGLVIFGVYFFMMGVLRLKDMYFATEPRETVLKFFSIPDWSLRNGGISLGLAVGALCKNAGLDGAGFTLFAVFFILAGGLFLKFQNEIGRSIPVGDSKTRREVVLLSVMSLVIGAVSLAKAWCLACSCGVNL